jgi:signal transduction histidine kinase
MIDSQERQRQIFSETLFRRARTIDRMFAGLFLFQWFLGIGLAIWISPLAWDGDQSRIHVHVYTSIIFGGLLALYPAVLAWLSPGRTFNRIVIAIAQMGFSVLLIHLTGGRIETHFHVFGSLAFLAFYRDYRPIVVATIVTAADHLLRGAFFPESVYGVLSATPWRAVEHSAWVLFEDVFLFLMIRAALTEMRTLSSQQVSLESSLQHVEQRVKERTLELEQSQRTILEQQQTLLASAKMSALGEMAGGIAHEINTPLAVIQFRADYVRALTKEDEIDRQAVENALENIGVTVGRIAKIVQGLRTFARDGRHDPVESVPLSKIFEDTIALCRERFQNHGVRLDFECPSHVSLDCRSTEMAQVLLNLLNNSFDAVHDQPEAWVRMQAEATPQGVRIRVSDSGPGIPEALREKIMQPFFTTKDIGKGTGLGLSISKGIVEAHGGRLFLDPSSESTCFVLDFPRSEAVLRPKVAA